MASTYLWYRGHKMSAQVKGALLAAEQRAGRTFTITQGGFNGTRVAASAGTHAATRALMPHVSSLGDPWRIAPECSRA